MAGGARHRCAGRTERSGNAVGSVVLRLAAVALVLLVPGGPVAAQVVRGAVVDKFSREPVVSGIVVLLGDDGAELDRVLTDATGRFLLRSRVAGEHRLRTLIIGFQPWESQAFALAAGQTVQRDVELELLRVALPPITVEAERTCVTRPGEGELAAALWEEVKKAVSATTLAAESRRYRFRTRTREQFVDRVGVTQTDTVFPLAPGYRAWPFASLDPELLSRRGFVQQDVGGPVFYGPDAVLLVSDIFLDDHCFRVRRRDNDQELGLLFEPVGGRRVPEIEGVLWLDRESTALRRLEWRYRNIPPWARQGQPSGSIEFSQLPDGAWFVRGWTLRAPVAQVFQMRADTSFYGVRIRNSQVTEVLNREGRVIVTFTPVEDRP